MDAELRACVSEATQLITALFLSQTCWLVEDVVIVLGSDPALSTRLLHIAQLISIKG